jgi:hypothetical protein
VEEAFPWPPAVASFVGQSAGARVTPSSGATTGSQTSRQSLLMVTTMTIVIVIL